MFKKCALCKNDIIGYGNNGQPLVNGQVCDECNKKSYFSKIERVP